MRLFEITLLEYNTDATLKNWGKRIAQAATFNEQNLGDEWFYREIDYPDRVRGLEGGVTDDESLAKAVLYALERMDPTKNKQYVMTLVRWYTGNIKKHEQLQNQYDDWRRYANSDTYGSEEHDDSGYPENYYDLENIADEFDNFEADFGNYVMTAENLDTFKLEDADQIRTALENYHRMKPQLPANERDIGRFKSFYRFEDFVDSKMDPELQQEIDDEILNRKDVEVIHNGPMGTVTIPKTHEASCELGSGTKWCTASKYNQDLYNSYSKKGDLIIYNEKPGNAKYQFQYYFDAERGEMHFEGADARDRQMGKDQEKYFLTKHPVLSKILPKRAKKSFILAMNQPYTSNFTPVNIAKAVKINAQYGGGAKPLLDGYFLSQMEILNHVEQQIGKGMGKGIYDAVAYAQQRGKPWPAFEEASIKQLNSFLMDIMGAKSSRSNISGGGASFKGDALMNLMRAGLVGKSGKFLEIYLKALKVYRDTVNPNWRALEVFFKAYRNVFGAHRDQNKDPYTGKRSSDNVGPPKKGQIYPNTPYDGPDSYIVPPIHPVEEMRMLLNKLN